VAQLIPGALETVEITPDMQRRIKRVKDTCDAEILR
jgi:pyruvate-ferredoxin/flavodoxin oxidoreductase